MGITSGVLIHSEEFRPWEKTLRQWINLMKKYTATVPGDLPYFYLERSNVGMLSAAIWKAGDCSMEEYGEIKHHRDGREFKGRIDLYAYLENFEYILEFKQVWPSLTYGMGDGAKNQTKAAYNAGKRSVRQAKIRDVPGVIGLFIVPYTYNPSRPNLREIIKSYLDWTLKQIGPEAAAWWFPKQCEFPVYPGVILLLRRPKKPIK